MIKIKELPLGTVVTYKSDPSTQWKIVSQNHFGENYTLLFLEGTHKNLCTIFDKKDEFNSIDYLNSTLHKYLQEIEKSMPLKLRNAILPTEIKLSGINKEKTSIERLFLLSMNEVFSNTHYSSWGNIDKSKEISYLCYVPQPSRRKFDHGTKYWTRTIAQFQTQDRVLKVGGVDHEGKPAYFTTQENAVACRYAFNISGDTLVDDSTRLNGAYPLILNKAPDKPNVIFPSSKDEKNPTLCRTKRIEFKTRINDSDKGDTISQIQVRLYKNDNLILDTDFVSNTTGNYTPNIDLEPAMLYKVEFRHKDDDGAISPWSDSYYFALKHIKLKLKENIIVDKGATITKLVIEPTVNSKKAIFNNETNNYLEFIINDLNKKMIDLKLDSSEDVVINDLVYSISFGGDNDGKNN